MPLLGNPHEFVANVLFYSGVKIVTSLDDLVWLSPFAALATTARQRTHVAAVYTAISCGISFVALVLAWLAIHGLTTLVTSVTMNSASDSDTASEEGEDKKTAASLFWTPSRVLNLVASVCIAILAYKEWNDSRNDDDDDDDEKEEDDEEWMSNPPDESTRFLTGKPSSSTVINIPNGDYSELDHWDDTEHTTPSVRQYRQHVLMDLLVVGILGQLDTLAVFLSVLVGQGPRHDVVAVVVGSVEVS